MTFKVLTLAYAMRIILFVGNLSFYVLVEIYLFSIYMLILADECLRR